MEHVDPEILALIALGEPAASQDDLDHLAECEQCATDLRELSEASAVGRSTVDIGVLVRPSARVWDAISAEVQRPVRRPIPLRRWVLAAVAAVIVAGLVVTGVVLGQRPPSSSELASAKLAALPAWSGASGTAVVRKLANGSRQIQISIAVKSTAPDFREAWLATPDLKHLISIGVLNGNTATFSVPKGVDLSKYDVIDVSDEPHDGNPSHSGNSIVRGQLDS